MKVTVELHGATKDLSKNNFLEFQIKKNSSIKDIKIKILEFIEKNFKGNQNLKKLIQSSAFCSEKDEIVSENYKINENQVIGIIPPIGGG
tara:strand:+ start:422 stop:691 length:270 start_codon:yes stop_codon:yes gene_type:complete